MRTIWKFPLSRSSHSYITIDMPRGARPLAVQYQGEQLTLWAEVDERLPMESRTFAVFGTGWELPREMGYSDAYIATVQDDPFVWHVYEVTGV